MSQSLGVLLKGQYVTPVCFGHSSQRPPSSLLHEPRKTCPGLPMTCAGYRVCTNCARKFVTALCTQPGRTVCSVVRKGGFFPGLLVCAGCVGALLWGAWKDNELHVLPVSAGLNSIGVLRDSWRAARGSRVRGSMAHRGAVCVLLLGLLVALAQGALLGAATLLCAGGFDEWAPSIKVAAAAPQPPGGKEALYQASLRLDCALKVFWQRGGAARRRPTITRHRRGRLGFRRVWRRGSHK